MLDEIDEAGARAGQGEVTVLEGCMKQSTMRSDLTGYLVVMPRRSRKSRKHVSVVWNAFPYLDLYLVVAEI